MTYEYEGKTWELTFAHRTPLMHERLEKPREGCELYIREAGKDAPKKIRWSAVTLLNPEDGGYQKEVGRQKAIANLYRDTDMGWDEYTLVRRAYFLRKRKTATMRRQTKLFNKELKRLLADADLPFEIRVNAKCLKESLDKVALHGTPKELQV